jgi:hypothetical protein
MSDTCKLITLTALLASQALLSQQTQAQDQDFSKPLGQVKRSQVESRSVITTNNNGNSIKLEMVNGKIEKVTHNGEELPANRYRLQDGKLEVMDKDGNVVHEMQVNIGGDFPAPPQVPGVPMLRDVPMRLFLDGNRMMIAPQAGEALPAPRVRMGIVMAPDDETNAVIVAEVAEDSPAQKAGLKVGDVIERIDTNRVQTQQDLRDALQAKNPGDKVTLKIDRDGEAKELTVELAKADDVPMNVQGFAFGEPQNMRSFVMIDRNKASENLASAEAKLKSAIEQLSKDRADLGDARKALNEALDSLRASREDLEKANGGAIELWGQQMGDWGERFGEQMGNWGERFGQEMGRFGQEMGQRIEREMIQRQQQFNNQQPREQRNEPRNEPRRDRNNNNDDAETRELRDMLKAMQDRLDRLEQQKNKGE